MRTKFFLFGVGIVSMHTADLALAHHAFSAEFDASSPVELRGVVTKTEWINPHSWITIEVMRGRWQHRDLGD